MKKSYRFNELSNQVCQGKSCQRLLKKRRVEEHGDTLCYACNLKAKLKDGSWANHPNKLRKAGILQEEAAS